MPAGGRHSHFEGRRVDLLMRDLDAPVGADPVAALRGWLEEGRTGASGALAAKGDVRAAAWPARPGRVAEAPSLKPVATHVRRCPYAYRDVS